MTSPATADDAAVLVGSLRRSHDDLTATVAGLDQAALEAGSYDSEWTVAQVLSHLGSGAEIFALLLESVLAGTPAPGGEAFPPIWDKWNARGPVEMRDDSVTSNELLVSRVESLDPATAGAFRMAMFGREVDLAGFTRMRLSEHAVHAWDVAVVLDPNATVDQGAVELMIDGLGATAGYSGKPNGEQFTVLVNTTSPERAFLVSVGEAVSLEPASPADAAATDGTVELPAEAFLRLVYGRLDPDHTPAGVVESGSRGLADLRAVFLGF